MQRTAVCTGLGLLLGGIGGCMPTSTTDTPSSTDTSPAPTGDSGSETATWTADTDCTGSPGMTVTIGGDSVPFTLSGATISVARYTYTGAFDIAGSFEGVDKTDTLSLRFTRWDHVLESGVRVPFGTTEFPKGDIRSAGLLSLAARDRIYHNSSEEAVIEGTLDLLCFDEVAQTVSVAWQGFAHELAVPNVDVPFSGRINHVPLKVSDVAL